MKACCAAGTRADVGKVNVPRPGTVTAESGWARAGAASPARSAQPASQAAPRRLIAAPPRVAVGSIESGIRTATTSPVAVTAPLAETVACTTTLRSPTSTARARTSSSGPSASASGTRP